jgi:hydroxymethylbilane synthase
MSERITALMSAEQSLPANGQGAVGIECRSDDTLTKSLLAPLEHNETRIRVLAERAMNRKLQGGCQVPIGAYATVNGDTLTLDGLVGALDGSVILKHQLTGNIADPEHIGEQLAEQLLAQGANTILADVYGE